MSIGPAGKGNRASISMRPAGPLGGHGISKGIHGLNVLIPEQGKSALL